MDTILQPKRPLHPYFRFMKKSMTYLSEDFLGGPKWIKLSWVINWQKGLTFFWVLGLIYWYNDTSPQALTYLALHGSYGFCWLLKDMVFPDPSWQTKVTFGGAFLSVLLVLGPYWLIPFVLIADWPSNMVGATTEWLIVAAIIHTLGIAIMLSADAQKYYTLSVKRGLITTGMFKLIRHPNYLGEIMIYSAYAIIVWHWLPWMMLISIWSLLFFTNIKVKEHSMSRYPEWNEYTKKTGLILPKLSLRKTFR